MLGDVRAFKENARMRTSEGGFVPANLRKFCHAIGWPELRRLEHTVPKSEYSPRHVIHWYESGCDNDLLLQINVRPYYCACVLAIRYRICSGWHTFNLSGPNAPLSEASRLTPVIGRVQFSSPSARRAFRAAHPEFASYSAARLREEGQPIAIPTGRERDCTFRNKRR